MYIAVCTYTSRKNSEFAVALTLPPTLPEFAELGHQNSEFAELGHQNSKFAVTLTLPESKFRLLYIAVALTLPESKFSHITSKFRQ